MGRRRFTLEICEDYAFEYSTRGEWQRNHNASYQAAWRNGWLDACTGHMREITLIRKALAEEAAVRKSKSIPAEFIPDSVIRIW